MIDSPWAEPETGGEAYIPLRFDSLGSPIYKHQLPPEEPSDER